MVPHMATAPVALHVIIFFPRGGSAQVVRYLSRFLVGLEAGVARPSRDGIDR